MIPGLVSPMLSSGGSGDVEPDAANWADITATDAGSNAAVTITGITQSIYMRADISSFTKSPSWCASNLLVTGSGGASLGSDIVGSGSQIEFGPIELGEEIYFTATGVCDVAWSWSATVTVKYKSNGSSTYDQTLDTFAINLSGSGGL